MDSDNIIGIALQIFGRAVCAGVIRLTDAQREVIRAEMAKYVSREVEAGPSAIRVLEAFELQSRELDGLRAELAEIKRAKVIDVTNILKKKA